MTNSQRLTLRNSDLTYLLVRSKRKSIGLQIGDEGLTVRAPFHLALSEIEKILLEKSIWIKSRLAYWRQCQANLSSLHALVFEGKPIPVLGKPYTLKFCPSDKRSSINHADQQFQIAMATPLNESDISKAVKQIERLLKPFAKTLFEQTATELAYRHTFPAFTVRLSNAKLRWGSCNDRGELRLNWRLIFYPKKALEYVIAHEISHLKEMNHSPAFWKEVEKLMPGYKHYHAYLADMHPSKVPLST